MKVIKDNKGMFKSGFCGLIKGSTGEGCRNLDEISKLKDRYREMKEKVK